MPMQDLNPAFLPALAQKNLKDIKPNILIVDDRKENLLATEKVLKPLDANIHKATSGNEALSLILRHNFAVVLLDVQMPEMDGFETASLMMEHDSMHGVPIIFVTAISKEEKYASRAAEIGAVDYIFKPINSDILRSKVRVYLDIYRQRAQIMDLNNTLRQSNEELERFAFICSHDLKSPLRAIDNIAQWLEEDIGESLTESSRRHMDELHKRIKRMEKLLDDTLEYARIGHDQNQNKPDIIDAYTLIQDVLALSAPPTGFKVEIGKTMADLRVNRLPLQQIFYNLINNAFKHHGGESGVIKVDVAEMPDRYVFGIKDDGVGIPEEYHQKIFEMFQTLKPRDRSEGSGMGLAFVKKILMNYGCEITVDSKPGEGTIFRFAWPKNEVNKPAPMASKSAA